MSSFIGIDIGHDRLKLVWIKDNKIAKVAVELVPENMIKDGKIVSVDSCGLFLKEMIQKNKMHCNNAALMVSENCMYVKTITTPQMSAEQLLYNIPYEFRDYIAEKTNAFLFDYAIIARHDDLAEGQEKKPNGKKKLTGTMDLTGIAISKEEMEKIRQTIKKAGLKLKKAAPESSAYRSILSRQKDFDENKEYCIVDLGYHATRMYMYKGKKLTATRMIDRSIRTIEQNLADELGVDVHLSGSYLENNFQDCQKSEKCLESYDALALDIARALKFYNYSNRESELNDIWICGGGANIEPLVTSVKNTITDMNIHMGSELLPHHVVTPADDMILLACGIAFLPIEKETTKSLKKDVPSKQTINLAGIGYKPFNYKMAVVGIVAICIGAAVLSKVLVVDRLKEINQYKRQLMQIRQERDMYYKSIEEYGDLVEVYAHYTYEDFEEEELKRMDRVTMINLIREVIQPKCTVANWNIFDNTLTISVVCKNLTEVNKIVESVLQDKNVNFCTVSSAATGVGNVGGAWFAQGTALVGDTAKAADFVNATLIITFADGNLYEKLGYDSQPGSSSNQ